MMPEDGELELGRGVPNPAWGRIGSQHSPSESGRAEKILGLPTLLTGAIPVKVTLNGKLADEQRCLL